MNNFASESISRRSFLKSSFCAACGCLISSPLFGQSTEIKPADTKLPRDYYYLHRKEILNIFRDTNQGAQQWLTSGYGKKTAGEVTREAERRFEDLIPLLPDVGGENNMMIEEIPIIACYVAYYSPMKSRGIKAEDLGRMIYDLYAVQLKQIPRARALAEGEKKFTPEYIARLKKWAAWTQQKEYPANWTATFISGDGKDFDYGYDYTECALVKYLKAHDAFEVAPYVCLNDFIRSHTFGTGLARTKTLAQGDSVCNFRYKKGRPVTQNWETEIGIIQAETIS